MYLLFSFQDLHCESSSLPSQSDNSIVDCKLASLSPPHKISRIETPRSENFPAPRNRDEFTVFGEYVANELRSLKGEKNLLVAKKKIQDVIFDVKMGMICDTRAEQTPTFTVETHTSQQQNTHRCAVMPVGGKLYTAPMSTTTHIEPLVTSHTPPTSGISEIIINGACHYTNFKVDTQ